MQIKDIYRKELIRLEILDIAENKGIVILSIAKVDKKIAGPEVTNPAINEA